MGLFHHTLKEAWSLVSHSDYGKAEKIVNQHIIAEHHPHDDLSKLAQLIGSYRALLIRASEEIHGARSHPNGDNHANAVEVLLNARKDVRAIKNY